MSNLNDIAGVTGQQTATEQKPKVKTELDALTIKDKEADLKLKEAELRLKLAQLQDVEESLAERQLKRDNKTQRSRTNGETLKALDSSTKQVQKRCNHKKGGNGIPGLVGGQGHDSQYAVLKHTFANGDMWVRCLRCGKTWKPPVHRAYKSEEEYRIAQAVYEQAVDFQTNNTPSSSYVFRYSDNGEFYRETTEYTTLR